MSLWANSTLLDESSTIQTASLALQVVSQCNATAVQMEGSCHVLTKQVATQQVVRGFVRVTTFMGGVNATLSRQFNACAGPIVAAWASQANERHVGAASVAPQLPVSTILVIVLGSLLGALLLTRQAMLAVERRHARLRMRALQPPSVPLARRHAAYRSNGVPLQIVTPHVERPASAYAPGQNLHRPARTKQPVSNVETSRP